MVDADVDGTERRERWRETLRCWTASIISHTNTNTCANQSLALPRSLTPRCHRCHREALVLGVGCRCRVCTRWVTRSCSQSSRPSSRRSSSNICSRRDSATYPCRWQSTASCASTAPIKCALRSSYDSCCWRSTRARSTRHGRGRATPVSEHDLSSRRPRLSPSLPTLSKHVWLLLRLLQQARQLQLHLQYR